MRKFLLSMMLGLYCVAIFLALDLIYSKFFHENPQRARVFDQHYDHGFVPNFDGYDAWGSLRHRLRTNSLGFKDAAVRDVPLRSLTRRILLIGDSMTEGSGMSFEDSFAGLLYRAGREGAENFEVLNAAVASYSPVLYFKKIKHLLDIGLVFDEVVVFSDITDVMDEATSYFCFDDEPQYKALCPPVVKKPAFSNLRKIFTRNFVVTNRVIGLATERAPSLLEMDEFGFPSRARWSWTIPSFNVKEVFHPLGVEGGVIRSLKNMQALADLLSQRRIPLTIVVYPYPMQLAQNDRDSRQVAIWREFCRENCKAFIDLFPVFFAEKDAHGDWYQRYFIPDDVHWSAQGHRLIFREVGKQLLTTR
jgi:hypothetical protein